MYITQTKQPLHVVINMESKAKRSMRYVNEERKGKEQQASEGTRCVFRVITKWLIAYSS